jgi:DNA-binding MarR family transcriptional regulator
MTFTPLRDPGAARRRLCRMVKEALRDRGGQLSLLNHSVGTRIDLKATDLERLDLISRSGPLSPSALSRRAGLHPATMTGLLDRLGRAGWIGRSRNPSDRRGVVVQGRPRPGRGIRRRYLVDSGMNAALDEICAGYGYGDLEFLAGFLRRTCGAGRAAPKNSTSPADQDDGQNPSVLCCADGLAFRRRPWRRIHRDWRAPRPCAPRPTP